MRSAGFCRSYTTRIAEVEDAGTPEGESTGAGLRDTASCGVYIPTGGLKKKKGGVYIECRAISLTRDIPLGLGWIIEPIIRKLPQESLVHTLEATRKGWWRLIEPLMLRPPREQE